MTPISLPGRKGLFSRQSPEGFAAYARKKFALPGRTTRFRHSLNTKRASIILTAWISSHKEARKRNTQPPTPRFQTGACCRSQPFSCPSSKNPLSPSWKNYFQSDSMGKFSRCLRAMSSAKLQARSRVNSLPWYRPAGSIL